MKHALILKIAMSLIGLSLLAGSAEAKPEYAAKEGKPCSYCHVNPAGGGPRNARGIYYAMHDHSFAGYDEARVMGQPHFTSAWKITVPSGTRRIAIADVVGDKQLRLLALGEDNTLTINRVTRDGLQKEALIDLGADAAHFAVGRFAKDRPALIAVPGAIFYKEGDKYTRKDTPGLKAIDGSARFVNNTESLLVFENGSPKTWTLDLSAADPLVPGKPLVNPQDSAGVLRNEILHASPEKLTTLGIPEPAAKSGVVGGFDPREDGRFYLFAPVVEANGTYLEIVNKDALSGGDPSPVWKSDRIDGKALDVAIGRDPRDGKQTGLFVLQATGDGGKDRVITFYALD
ncbi:MAG TPA: hypothetical protein VFA07_00200 [Chthonomonadaceae bacterium]|nr:hypothetical protein [Chthonomonadaceae bacterium]